MKDKLNFMKWQILARLPNGNIYERIKESIKDNNCLEDDPFYYIYWLDINKSLFTKYLFGSFRTINEDYIKFINWLNKNFRKDDFFEINVNSSIIKIPIPLIRDYKCFKAEFLDIIMPYIVKDRNMNQPFLEGPYEFKDVVISQGDIVLDLGANFGLFSSLASSRDCEVYAFEPTPRIINDYLERLERINSNVHIVNKAVSNISGSSLFKIHENKSSCNCLYSDTNDNCENLVKVETVSVDDFVLQNKLECVNFIKADIEGAERLMLEGAKETLSEYAPNLAICYYHNLDDLKVLRKMILDANPKYEIDVAYKKIYARVPNK